MSFGDSSSTSGGPISGLIGGAIRSFDQVLGPAFNSDKPKTSLVNAPAPSSSSSSAPLAPAPSADTPGRHKSLLGQ